MKLYMIEDGEGDDPVYVAASSFAQAIARFEAMVRVQNPGEVIDTEPQIVALVAGEANYLRDGEIEPGDREDIQDPRSGD